MEIPFVDSHVEASRQRVRRRTSGSTAPVAADEADARPGEKNTLEGLRRRERPANEKKCQMSLRTIIGIFVYSTTR